MESIDEPNFFCTLSLSKYLENKKLKVAPRVEANETNTVPSATPKIAPAASVNMVAPGIETATLITYTRK